MYELIEKKNAVKVLRETNSNKQRKYPQKGKDGERLYPVAYPTPRPSFDFDLKNSVFAIGSCFARNLERYFQKKGGNVVSKDFDFQFSNENKTRFQRDNRFNKYSIHSVYNDLLWALERDSYTPENCIIPLNETKCVDLQLGSAVLEASFAEVVQARSQYLDHMAKTVDADVLVLTLGYVETWFDCKTNLYLNVMPTPALIKAEPERYEFRVLNYDEVYDRLQKTVDLLKKHRTKPLKMLLTVSPVPLLTTFRNVDILTANMYSKSVQRAAVERVVMENDGVDYFPSFEAVMLSHPEASWRHDDYRHVSNEIVEKIMDNVVDAYMPNQNILAKPPFSESKFSKEDYFFALANLKADNRKEFLDFMVKNRVKTYHHPFLLRKEIEWADDGADSLDSSHLDMLGRVSSAYPQKPLYLEALALGHKKTGNLNTSKDLLKLLVERFPKRQTDAIFNYR